jgi:acyl carrier protein
MYDLALTISYQKLKMNEQFKAILEKIKPEIFDDPDCDLIEDGVIDSLDIMMIITATEQEFEIEYDPDEVTPENFSSVDNIWNLINKYMNQ